MKKRLIVAACAAACLFANLAVAGTEGFSPVKCMTRPWLCR